MNELAERGVAIIMVSSDLSEILGISDRVIVVHEGHIAGELTKEEATEEGIMTLATGGIDLSVGSTLALSSAIMGGMIVNGIDPLIAMTVSLIAGFVLGAENGLLITKGKLVPFIATLATMTIYRGATLVLTDGKPITGLDETFIFQFMGRGYFFGIPFPIVITLVVFALLFVLLHKMSFGRKTFAIGGNEKASFIAGVKSNKIKIFVYSISGALASLAGIILTSRLNSAQPTAGESYEMDAIASVVLGGTSMSGGKGRIFGTLIGALIIGTLNNGLNLLGVSTFYQQIVKGIVIIIAVLIDRRK
jgi:ribose transport system permease protein